MNLTDPAVREAGADAADDWMARGSVTRDLQADDYEPAWKQLPADAWVELPDGSKQLRQADAAGEA